VLVRNPLTAILATLRIENEYYDEIVQLDRAQAIASGIASTWKAVVEPIVTSYPKNRLMVVRFEDLVTQEKMLPLVKQLVQFMDPPDVSERRVECSVVRARPVLRHFDANTFVPERLRSATESLLNLEKSDEKKELPQGWTLGQHPDILCEVWLQVREYSTHFGYEIMADEQKKKCAAMARRP
jgi:hypothetical protein